MASSSGRIYYYDSKGGSRQKVVSRVGLEVILDIIQYCDICHQMLYFSQIEQLSWPLQAFILKRICRLGCRGSGGNMHPYLGGYFRVIGLM